MKRRPFCIVQGFAWRVRGDEEGAATGATHDGPLVLLQVRTRPAPFSASPSPRSDIIQLGSWLASEVGGLGEKGSERASE